MSRTAVRICLHVRVTSPSPNTGRHPEDLPWNDESADNDVFPGTTEPDPAEVVGDETNARDRAGRRVFDPNVRESLDERLAEEEPDRAPRASDPEAGEFVWGSRSEDDVAPAEPDQEDPVEDELDELPAEEAAMHVVSDDDVI